MSLPQPTERRSHRQTLFNIALAVIGSLLLVVTVRRAGWAEVQGGLAQVGWWFPVVVLLGGIRFAARARAWMACAEGIAHSALGTGTIPRAGPRQSALGTPHFFGATLAGDALGNLTPLGLLASEPAKILLVRDRLPTVTAIVSVAAENTFYIASVVVMVATGAAVFISSTDLPVALRTGVQGVLVVAGVAAVIAVAIARRQPAVLSRLARMLSALTGRGRTSSGYLQEVESTFYAVLGWPTLRLARVIAWEALFHLAAVAEVFLVLRLLPGGQRASLADAFVLETAGRLIAVVFKVVPYRLGVDEAGTALVAGALSLDPTAGVTLALIRRLRIFFWNAIGLVVLARSK